MLNKVQECPHCKKKNFTQNPRCSSCGKRLDDPPEVDEHPIVIATPPPPITTPPPLHPTTKPRGGFPMPPPPPPIPSWEFHPLPRHFPGYLADLEGEIVDVSIIKNERKTNSCLGWTASILLLPFQPIMALMIALGIIQRPKEFIEYTHYRVKRIDGSFREARIELNIKSGAINMGDLVQFWGPKLGNTVIVKYAFNHTIVNEVKLGK